MDCKVLDTPKSELGEGIFLNEEHNKLFWLDIVGGNIFQYCLKSNSLERKFLLTNNPSAILSCFDGKRLIYIDNIGLKSLCLDTGGVTELLQHPNHCSKSYRANDGVMLADGSFIYGTMSYSPQEQAGRLNIVKKNHAIESNQLNINIPNSFVEFDNQILISDSLKQCVYQIDVDALNDAELTVWKDFSDSKATPDGGFISDKGYIHLALWDGCSVAVLNKQGQIVHEIKLPVLRPTNCSLYRNRWLYVTSAFEGMTEEQLKEYPLSGQTLVVDLGHNYEY